MTTASASAPLASNIRPRWSSGSCDVDAHGVDAVDAPPGRRRPASLPTLALAASSTSTMNEIPSPSAIAWLSLLTSGDRSRRRANQASQRSVDTTVDAYSPSPCSCARRRRGCRRRASSRARRATTMLVGTPRADVIRGLAGNDRLIGAAGRRLPAGRGRARHDRGGAGNDRVAASYDGGRDTVRCGAGADVVNADLTTPSRATASSSAAGSRATRMRPATRSTRPRSSRTASRSGGRRSRRSRSAAAPTVARRTSGSRSRRTTARPGGAASSPG